MERIFFMSTMGVVILVVNGCIESWALAGAIRKTRPSHMPLSAISYIALAYAVRVSCNFIAAEHWIPAAYFPYLAACLYFAMRFAFCTIALRASAADAFCCSAILYVVGSLLNSLTFFVRYGLMVAAYMGEVFYMYHLLPYAMYLPTILRSLLLAVVLGIVLVRYWPRRGELSAWAAPALLAAFVVMSFLVEQILRTEVYESGAYRFPPERPLLEMLSPEGLTAILFVFFLSALFLLILWFVAGRLIRRERAESHKRTSYRRNLV